MNNTFWTLMAFLVISLFSYMLGYTAGKKAGEDPAPTEQAWLEAKKYQIDKEWQYLLKLHEEERDEKKNQC